MSYLIAGLGNPGKKYQFTRHNLGYLIVEKFAQEMGINWQKKTLGYFGTAVLSNEKIHLLLPTTYMNLSGTAIRFFSDYLKISSTNILVVVDDIELSFGRFRLRLEGGTGGHNGLKSVQQHLGTQQYPRLRAGVDTPSADNLDLAEFVLEEFSSYEKKMLPEIILEAVSVIKLFISDATKAIERAGRFRFA